MSSIFRESEIDADNIDMKNPLVKNLHREL